MERKPETKREVVKKPINWFKFDNVRQKFEKNPLIELGKSLRRRQITPLLVKPDGTVIEGNRRALAAELEGLAELDCIIISEDLSPSELRAIQIVAATQREGLTGHELYLGVYEVLQCNPGKPLKEIAEMVSMDPASLTRTLAASKLDAKGMQAFAEGKLTTSDVYLITQADDEAERLALLEAKLNGSIRSREALKHEVKARKKPTAETDAKRVSRFKADISGVVVTLAGASLDTAALISVLTNLLKLAKDAKKKHLSLSTFEAQLRDEAESKTGKGEAA